MNDETYVFIQDVRERKVTARGARHKVNGSHSKKCTLSQDTLTPAQLKRRNGPVLTCDLNKPYTLAYLRTLSRHMQIEYMENLLSKFNPTNTQLSNMLDCSPTWLYSYLKSLGIDGTGSRPNKAEKLAFEDWLHADDIPAEEPAPEEPAPEDKPKPKLSPISYDTITLSFTGTTTDLIQSILTGPIHLVGADVCTFTITATKKGA